MLVGVGWKRAPRFPGMPAGEQGRESLSELVELAHSAGAQVAGTVFQLREAADPATLVGRGKLDEIRAEATAHKAPLIIFDSNLSPVQQRNIETATDRRVMRVQGCESADQNADWSETRALEKSAWHG